MPGSEPTLEIWAGLAGRITLWTSLEIKTPCPLSSGIRNIMPQLLNDAKGLTGMKYFFYLYRLNKEKGRRF
jgi:hypothetical protein